VFPLIRVFVIFNGFFVYGYRYKKKETMKRLSQILKIFQLFILLPFEITKGSKKKAYMKIKKTMIAANLL
jgi:hypothetical protein